MSGMQQVDMEAPVSHVSYLRPMPMLDGKANVCPQNKDGRMLWANRRFTATCKSGGSINLSKLQTQSQTQYR